MKDMKDTDWKEVITQMEEVRLHDLPDEEWLHHTYTLSDSFYCGMRRLTKRMRRQAAYARVCACVAAGAAVFLVLILATHPQEAAEAARRVMVWMEDFAEFKFQEDSEVSTIPAFTLNYVPEGYELVMEENHEVTGLQLYSNGEDEWMFWYGPSDASIGLNNEGVDFSIIEIGDGRKAYYFEATDGVSDNSMLWLSKEETIVFTITGLLSKEEIIKICKGTG